MRIVAGVVVAVVLLAAVVVIARSGAHGSGPTPNGAFDACLRFASERMGAAASSKFSALDPLDLDSRASLLGQHPPRFEVTARVDSPNRSGAMLRNHLTCDVVFEDAAYRWSLVGLSFSDKPAVRAAADLGDVGLDPPVESVLIQ